MLGKELTLIEEFTTFFFKIFIPAFVAISIKIATQIKNEKMNLTKVIISFIVGIGCAYFIYPFINNTIDKNYIPLLVGIVAMSGEKITEYIIYKWNVSALLQAFVDFIINQIRPKK